MKKQLRVKEFSAYVWSFYGPHEIHGDFFNHTLTKAELKVAVVERVMHEAFEGDSVDREAVRDIMLAKRGAK